MPDLLMARETALHLLELVTRAFEHFNLQAAVVAGALAVTQLTVLLNVLSLDAPSPLLVSNEPYASDGPPTSELSDAPSTSLSTPTISSPPVDSAYDEQDAEIENLDADAADSDGFQEQEPENAARREFSERKGERWLPPLVAGALVSGVAFSRLLRRAYVDLAALTHTAAASSSPTTRTVVKLDPALYALNVSDFDVEETINPSEIAISLQAAARGFLARRQLDVQREHLQAETESITRLQSLARRTLVRRRDRRQRFQLVQARLSIVRLQAVARAGIVRREIDSQRSRLKSSEIVALQSLARAALLRRQLRDHHSVVIALQAIFRGRNERLRLAQLHTQLEHFVGAFIEVQSLARGFAVRKGIASLRQRVTTAFDQLTCLQALGRGKLERGNYERLVADVQQHVEAYANFQATARGVLARQQVAQQVAALQSATANIAALQAHARGQLARRQLESTQIALSRCSDSIIAVQRISRGAFVRRASVKLQDQLNSCESSILAVQAICRGKLARQHAAAAQARERPFWTLRTQTQQTRQDERQQSLDICNESSLHVDCLATPERRTRGRSASLTSLATLDVSELATPVLSPTSSWASPTSSLGSRPRIDLDHRLVRDSLRKAGISAAAPPVRRRSLPARSKSLPLVPSTKSPPPSDEIDRPMSPARRCQCLHHSSRPHSRAESLSSVRID